jgi:hypothetical protein
MKAPIYPEYVCLAHAARALGRPVKWTDERSGSFMSDHHGRDHEITGELALDAEGRFLALRMSGYGNVGAYLSTVAPQPPSMNLVRNACQYTSCGAVTVTLAPGILTVDDTGPGLPLPVRERLVRRAGHPVPAAGAVGNGLGLSIVRRVAEHLHWTLSFEDRRGGGTRVSVVIPSLQPA